MSSRDKAALRDYRAIQTIEGNNVTVSGQTYRAIRFPVSKGTTLRNPGWIRTLSAIWEFAAEDYSPAKGDTITFSGEIFRVQDTELAADGIAIRAMCTR